MRHGGRDFCRTKLSREKASDESRRVMMKVVDVATLEVRIHIRTPHAGTEVTTDPAPREVPVTPERPRVIGLSAMCSAGWVADGQGANRRDMGWTPLPNRPLSPQGVTIQAHAYGVRPSRALSSLLSLDTPNAHWPAASLH